MPVLAVSKTEVLLSVSEERLSPPSHRVQRDEMACCGVDFVGDDVLHARVIILITRLFLRDQEFSCTELIDLALLYLDGIGVVINRSRHRR